MEEELRVLYITGVAICVMASSRASAAREGGGGASVGVVQAEGSSREIPKKFGVPTLSTYAEGLVAGGVSASRWGTPRGHSPSCMYEALHAENREAPWSPVPAGDAPSLGFAGWCAGGVAGREGNASAVSP